MVSNYLRRCVDSGIISELDRAFANFVYEQERQHPQLAAMFACYLSKRLSEQDTCLELHRVEQIFLPDFRFPEADQLHQLLTECDMVTSPEKEEEVKAPMVLEAGRAYLQRYWFYEKQLALQLKQRACLKAPLPVSQTRAVLSQLFDKQQEVDWQQVAVVVAAQLKLSFITGGPGTGKTTTVAKLLALLNGLARERGDALRINMVAPTGKAAARLSESMIKAREHLPPALAEGLPQNCSTIHRLLGTLPNRAVFKHSATNPLHLDVLVVDEASMIDLPLMYKLFDALPRHTRIILLGDKEQLASVEAGSVLSDICSAASWNGQQVYSEAQRQSIKQITGYSLPQPTGEHQKEVSGGITDNLVELKKSHRFSAQSDIGALARAINSGDASMALSLLNDDARVSVQLDSQASPEQFVAKVTPRYQAYFRAVKQRNIADAFAAWSAQQVLCAQRNGPWGVVQLNQRIEKALSRRADVHLSQEFYIGRPIMLTQNDHSLKLFNGDIGVVMPDPAKPEVLKVWFMESQGRYRGVLPSRLPPHETVYAMTIHKSQGSEFDHVMLCLPDVGPGNYLPRGLTRELLYTGLTRAKSHFELYAKPLLVEGAIGQRCIRSSGLAARLGA